MSVVSREEAESDTHNKSDKHNRIKVSCWKPHLCSRHYIHCRGKSKPERDGNHDIKNNTVFFNDDG